MFKVYLAGPIAGLTYDAAQDWRSEVTKALAPEISCYSPLRQKHFLRGEIGTKKYKDVLATDRGIMTRDHFDCMTSDLIFVNYLGTTKVSRGTDMELAFAFAYRKPVIVAVEPDSSILDHPMVREAVQFRTATLAEAIALTRAVLLPEAVDSSKKHGVITVSY